MPYNGYPSLSCSDEFLTTFKLLMIGQCFRPAEPFLGQHKYYQLGSEPISSQVFIKVDDAFALEAYHPIQESKTTAFSFAIDCPVISGNMMESGAYREMIARHKKAAGLSKWA